MAGNSRKVCQKKDKSKKLTKKFDNIEEAVCNKQGNTIFSFVFDQNLCKDLVTTYCALCKPVLIYGQLIFWACVRGRISSHVRVSSNLC